MKAWSEVGLAVKCYTLWKGSWILEIWNKDVCLRQA